MWWSRQEVQAWGSSLASRCPAYILILNVWYVQISCQETISVWFGVCLNNVQTVYCSYYKAGLQSKVKTILLTTQDYDNKYKRK